MYYSDAQRVSDERGKVSDGVPGEDIEEAELALLGVSLPPVPKEVTLNVLQHE